MNAKHVVHLKFIINKIFMVENDDAFDVFTPDGHVDLGCG